MGMGSWVGLSPPATRLREGFVVAPVGLGGYESDRKSLTGIDVAGVTRIQGEDLEAKSAALFLNFVVPPPSAVVLHRVQCGIVQFANVLRPSWPDPC